MVIGVRNSSSIELSKARDLMKEIRDEIRSLAPDSAELRKFSWVVGGAFVVLWVVLAKLLPMWDKGGDYPLLWWLGSGLAVVGTIAPLLVKPFFYAWMSLAFVLGFFMTRVILTIFFFVILTPVGLVFKVLRKDPLHRTIDRDAATYWIPKEYPIADRSRFEKFF